MPSNPLGFSTLRKQAGLSIEDLAQRLGVSSRTVRRWEAGEIAPKKMAVQILSGMPGKNNRKHHMKKETAFSFIDLFAGIGGIRIPFEEAGGGCVFSSEWDKFAQITYAANFEDVPSGDITKIAAEDIPEHDILLAGFPCQAFSQAGLRQGFQDTRGTMFFEIQRILSYHRPKAFVLENVKQLRGHDKGRTLKTILAILRGESVSTSLDDVPMTDAARASLKRKLNYNVDFKVLRATDFGVPQNRERVYIVGFNKDYFGDIGFEEIFQWPAPVSKRTNLGQILENNKNVDPKYTLSDKLWDGHKRRKLEHQAKGNGFGYSLFNRNSLYANTISARYYKDGSEILIDQSDIGRNPRKLTPRECARLQGFPESFILNCVSDVQAYKQFGNSVSVPVIRAISKKVLEAFSARDKKAGVMKRRSRG